MKLTKLSLPKTEKTNENSSNTPYRLEITKMQLDQIIGGVHKFTMLDQIIDAASMNKKTA